MKVLIVVFLLFPVFLFAGELNEPASMPLTFDQETPQNSVTPYAGISRGGAFAINIFLGFGIGSFIQRDVWGGVIGLAGDFVGIGMFTYGLLGAFAAGMRHPFGSTPDEEVTPYQVLAFTGIIVYLGSRIFQCIKPWFFKYPDDLQITASLNESGKIAVTALWCLKY